MSSAAFDDLGVLPEITRAVDEQGWLLPTPVQAESIPLILGGGDVMAVNKQTNKQTQTDRQQRIHTHTHRTRAYMFCA